MLVALDGSVLVNKSYGIPEQPKYMPTTTVPAVPLGDITQVFTALCAQLPVDSGGRGGRGGRGGSGESDAADAAAELCHAPRLDTDRDAQDHDESRRRGLVRRR